jgi:hypothetical protein
MLLLLRTSPPHPRKRQSKRRKREWDRNRQVNPALAGHFNSAVGFIKVEMKDAHTGDCLEEEVEVVIDTTIPDIPKRMLVGEKSL